MFEHANRQTVQEFGSSGPEFPTPGLACSYCLLTKSLQVFISEYKMVKKPKQRKKLKEVEIEGVAKRLTVSVYCV